jgi:membrane carboxypeptidase/penicillin-binding protein PbpC
MHNVTGVTGAAPIWNETIRDLLQGEPDRPFLRPEGLKQVEVCGLSGLLPTPDCPHTRLEWFIPGTEPTQPDTYYQKVWIDPSTGLIADASLPPDRRKPLVVLDLPVEAQPWARAQGLPLLADLKQGANVASVQADSLALISPAPNTTYRIAADFDPAAQQLSVEAVAGQGVTQVRIYADGRLLTPTGGLPYQAWWTLSAGQHRFWVSGVGANGETVTSEVVTIVVLP